MQYISPPIVGLNFLKASLEANLKAWLTLEANTSNLVTTPSVNLHSTNQYFPGSVLTLITPLSGQVTDLN